jgi:uncharacterized membrane protein YraQ (UPF0718 family)
VLLDLTIAGGAAAGLAYTAARDRAKFREALGIIRTSLSRMVPAIVLTMFAAGLLVPVIPSQAVGPWIGESSGVTGVVIASLLGGLIPSGPMISFPIILILQDAGAGTAQLVSLLSAWSVVAVHRLVAFEVPLMGPVFTIRRLAASIAIPFISGLCALALSNI